MRALFGVVALLTVGCTSLWEKRQSQWKELETVGEISCATVPVANDDIGLESLQAFTRGGKALLWAEVKKRNGSKRYDAAMFFGHENLTDESFVDQALEAEASVMGGSLSAHGKIVAMQVHKQQADETMEGERILKLYREGVQPPWAQAVLPASAGDGHLQFMAEGAWLKMRENNHFRLAYIPNQLEASQLTLNWLEVLFRYKPTLLGGPQAEATYALYLEDKSKIRESPQDFATMDQDFNTYLEALDAEGGEQGLAGGPDEGGPDEGMSDVPLEAASAFEFRLRRLGFAEKLGQPLKLNLPTEAGVEMWAATGEPGSFRIAYIEGDSLAGRSQLHIASFSLEQGASKRQWIRSFPLNDVHVADLLWLDRGVAQQLVFLQWVDGERTIASYRVDANGAKFQGYGGIFPRDSAMVDAFAYRADTKAGAADPKEGAEAGFAIIRSKVKSLWQYDICHLGDL